MPKNASLFGKYLRHIGPAARKGYQKSHLVTPIPPKQYGRPPSASSQTGLYHDEDFNYYCKVSHSLKKHQRKLKPAVFKKDFVSERLNAVIPNVRVTTSALHAMDDCGGFDEYILRTSPEELRSNLGETLRDVMYFYIREPEVRSWGLPWKVFKSDLAKKDPHYARHLHLQRKKIAESKLAVKMAKFSPYYLPPKGSLHPERQPFLEHSEPSSILNLWWTKSPEMEEIFRRRLGEATSFDHAHASHKIADGYRKGNGRGGGGQHGTSTRLRSKTYKFHEIRPY